MDVFKIKNSARKALMAYDPHYHSWPADQQERFRATMSEAIHNRVHAMLLKEILGIQCTAENAAAKAESWLLKSHKGNIKKTDPNAVTSRKKRKVVIAPGAFDD